MDFEITATSEYLRACVYARETIEETREFIDALARAHKRYGRAAILIDVHQSRAIFHSEPRGFLECFRDLTSMGPCKIALIGDTPELRLSHEYLALLARQQGLSVWSFQTEAAALKWLTDRRQGQERRTQAAQVERAPQPDFTEQRRIPERRYGWPGRTGGAFSFL